MADLARKVIAVLIALRALTNLGKPFAAGSGFVVVGRLLHGIASTIVAPIFGVVMLVYAYGLWLARPYALPLGVAYAVWATVNVVLLFPGSSHRGRTSCSPCRASSVRGSRSGSSGAVSADGQSTSSPRSSPITTSSTQRPSMKTCSRRRPSSRKPTRR